MKVLNLLILSIFLFLMPITYAWDDCPYGRVNCTYPGECGRYVDTNHDGICDHSEPPPVDEGLNTKAQEQSNEANEEASMYNEYVNISGKELKSLTILQVCQRYNIDPKCLKEKLGINASDNMKINEIKELYGIPPSAVKKAIFECMIDEGKIKFEENTESVSDIKDKTDEQTSSFEKIVSFLFSTINLREVLFGWL